MNRIATLACGLAAAFSSAYAAEIYVSPAGKDTSSGAKDQPLASLAAARDKTRPLAGKEAVTVHIADGVYYLPETLLFTPADSGTEENPVIYRAENEGGAVLSGGSKLTLKWQPANEVGEGVFKATTAAGLAIDQLFVNGTNQRMARYPNYDASKKAEAYQGFAADAFSKQRAAGWADPTGGYIHAMHRSRWGGYHYLITGKDAAGEITHEGGWQNNRQMGMHKDFRMVENIFEELDAEGEWYHNSQSNTLYYKPSADTDLASASVEVVRLRHLVEFQGTASAPVKHITFQGSVVRHAARTFMDTKEQMLRSDWAIYRGGAFMLTGTEDIAILDSEFDQVGGNAIFVNNYNRRTLVKGCHIHDAGASGVCFVGDPDAVRDPLFEYREKNDLSKIDRTPGPKSNNYPSLGIVEDCLIHGIGRTERQPAGVQMEMAMEITIRDTSIYDTARAGINVGDGAWGGHLIERVDVFDTVLETHDHGSFNSWGRDRYWSSDHLTTSQQAVDKEPNLPFLDATKTTVIRNSRWRCDHGWDIDLDDGSSNYDIYNNLLLQGGLKLREGYRRHAWNNITVNNGLHPHVWFQKSKDQVYSNIFMAPARMARMSEPYTDETMVDKNLYSTANKNVMHGTRKIGWDKNSIVADAMFIDPENGDYRVKEGSPAFDIGFENFPMDQFGVKKPSLKAIARTPILPTLDGAINKDTGKPVAFRFWLGAKLSDLSGDEFSAYGVSQESGGVAIVMVPAGAPAMKAGLQTGDLIQSANGVPTPTMAEFFKVLSKTGPAPLKLSLIRNQQPLEVTVVPDTDQANAFPGKKTDFKGYDRYDIKTDKGSFAIVCPKVAAPGKPWLWRSLFWEKIPKFLAADLQLVKQGYHVVLAHGNVHGHPSGNANIDAAYEYVTQEHGFSKKCSMASMSRGTLSLFTWAELNPEKVSSIVVDNGVCNVDSWPGGKPVAGSGSIASGNAGSWKGMKEVYGFTTDQELLDAEVSPIDKLEPLAKAGVPILMVCGSKDPAVPYEENDAIMEERYKKLGAEIQVIIEDKGHTHGMNDPTPVIEFIKKHTAAQVD